MAATSVGAAILFFPTLLEPTGFMLSVSLLLLAWGLTTYASLLFLEVTLWFPPGSHFILMGQKLLGRPMTVISWMVYLLLMYFLLSAYLTSFLVLWTNVLSYFNYSSQIVRGMLFCGVLLTACLLYFSRPFIKHCIVAAAIVLLFFFAVFVFFSAPHVHIRLLAESHNEFILSAIAPILIAFAYHFIIPRVRDNIDGEQFKNARRIIFSTGLVLLFLYLVWIAIIFGAFPVLDKYGILHYVHTPPLTTLIQHSFEWAPGASWVLFGHVIFFFALCASFLTIANSLYNLAATSFKITRHAGGRLFLLAFIFIPPLCYTLFVPNGLIFALTLVGIFICYLYVIVPALLCWRGRHAKQTAFGYRVKGGRPMLAIMILVGGVLIGLQIYSLFT
jgi:tyrosine-specific transport protein